MSLLTNNFRAYQVERLSGDDGSRAYSVISNKNFRGFIQPLSGDESFKLGKSGEEASHRLYTRVGAPVQKGDKISQKGQVYIAVFTNQLRGITGFSKHKEIILRVFE